jgi:hypothetical protein
MSVASRRRKKNNNKVVTSRDIASGKTTQSKVKDRKMQKTKF